MLAENEIIYFAIQIGIQTCFFDRHQHSGCLDGMQIMKLNSELEPATKKHKLNRHAADESADPLFRTFLVVLKAVTGPPESDQ
jgi:hypothetical protein